MNKSHGQALVEFSLAFIVFSVLVLGVVDFGRGIYQYNAVSQAAREIARVTSVHPCAALPCTFTKPGDVLSPSRYSAQTIAVIAVQDGLIPRLGDPTISCVHPSGAALGPSENCDLGADSIQVVVTSPFSAMTPPLSAWVSWNMKGVSSVRIQ